VRVIHSWGACGLWLGIEPKAHLGLEEGPVFLCGPYDNSLKGKAFAICAPGTGTGTSLSFRWVLRSALQ